MVGNPFERRSVTDAAQQLALIGQLSEAKRLHLSGSLQSARQIYEHILQAKPNNPEVQHLFAVLLHQLGENGAAINLLKRLLKINRANPVVWMNLANAQRGAGQILDALQNYKKAISLNPRYVEAYTNLGMLLNELGRFEDGLTQADKAISLNDKNLEALNNRGNALRGLGRPIEALDSYNRAIAINPRIAATYYNRGIALQDLGRHQEAVESYDAALAIKPDFALALNNRANSLRSLRRFRDALASVDRALSINPVNPLAIANRADCLRELGRHKEALESYTRAIELEPRFAEAFNNKAILLRDLGEFEEACPLFERAIALQPTASIYYANLATAKKFTPGDPLIAELEKIIATDRHLAAGDRANLEYTLGKALADFGDDARAIEHFIRGAAAKRQTIDYDETARMRLFDRIESVFTPELIRAYLGLGDPSSRPIFIVGMPRSGTTLVEQILASHPAVFGAGELPAMNIAINRLETARTNTRRLQFPELVHSLDANDLTHLGRDYLKDIAEISNNAERVTDKMPMNFLFLGLIKLALPNAMIIHTIRDPLDTCMSCFSILFSDPQNYSYDLGELGRHYRRYEALMNHWRTVLPTGSFIDIHYENVVADLETEARRILAYCDLPWDDACLAFHQTKRAVRTASAVQVRQPIYTNSIGRWQHHAERLKPLLAELGYKI